MHRIFFFPILFFYRKKQDLFFIHIFTSILFYTSLGAQTKPQQNLYFRSFQYGYQTAGCECKIIIDSLRTITTINLGCDSSCNYLMGVHKKLINETDYQKFIKRLSYPNLLSDFETKSMAEVNYGVSYKSTNIISTYKGNYKLNEFSSFDAQDSLWNRIWKIRCNEGLVDSTFLIDSNLYWEKIICYYPETKNDFKSHYTLHNSGELNRNRFKGSEQTAENIGIIMRSDITAISKLLKSKHFYTTQKTIYFTRTLPQKKQKHYYIIYTNKGIYQINSNELKKHLLKSFEKST